MGNSVRLTWGWVQDVQQNLFLLLEMSEMDIFVRSQCSWCFEGKTDFWFTPFRHTLHGLTPAVGELNVKNTGLTHAPYKETSSSLMVAVISFSFFPFTPKNICSRIVASNAKLASHLLHPSQIVRFDKASAVRILLTSLKILPIKSNSSCPIGGVEGSRLWEVKLWSDVIQT